jgi:hypothetical protein
MITVRKSPLPIWLWPDHATLYFANHAGAGIVADHPERVGYLSSQVNKNDCTFDQTSAYQVTCVIDREYFTRVSLSSPVDRLLELITRHDQNQGHRKNPSVN